MVGGETGRSWTMATGRGCGAVARYNTVLRGSVGGWCGRVMVARGEDYVELLKTVNVMCYTLFYVIYVIALSCNGWT